MNKIKLVVEQCKSSQIATAAILVCVGSQSENQSGIAHLVEHMVFKGTKKRSGLQISHDIENLGGHINAYTSKEATVFYVRTLAIHIKKAIEVLCDLVFNPRFDPKDLESEKSVVKEEIKYYQETPEEIVRDGIYELLYPDHNIGRPISGTCESVDAISADDLHDFHRNYFNRNNVIISVAGDVIETEISLLIEDLTRDVPDGDRNIPDVVLQPLAFQEKSTSFDISQSHVIFGYKGCTATSSDRYIAALLCNILGQGFSSRLHQNVRESRGLAYSVYSSMAKYGNFGIMTIYMSTDSRKSQEAITVVLETVNLILSDGVTSEELERAKAQAMTHIARDGAKAICFDNLYNLFYYNRLVDIKDKMRSIEQVTLEDISRVARDMLTQHSLLTCVGTRT